VIVTVRTDSNAVLYRLKAAVGLPVGGSAPPTLRG
jgi:hypothetical protein